MTIDQQQTFNPNEHLVQLKSRQGSQDYLPVQWRLVWFRTLCPQGTIDTEEIEVDTEREVEVEAFVWSNEKRRSEKVTKKNKGYARFRAIVTDGKGGRATGTKSENAANFADYIEKAETGAIGRALAALGYGTQFAPDLNEEHRIVDSPVERSEPGPQPQSTPQTANPVQYLTKEEVEHLRQDWTEICNIQQEKIAERWKGFKVYINEGTFISDERLTPALQKKMQDYIDMRRPQQKAS